ncbi:hypothetical protein HNY73_008336 [Argiope bruennichi]|uniref:Uncharacterized protein n=1 Tax=Argiope bruennichi TaxID=94029 RepID=A0A8T0FB49_ARGBR|nr:hypothetical protein HNY73_008336 [Argiope bruennichi]
MCRRVWEMLCAMLEVWVGRTGGEWLCGGWTVGRSTGGECVWSEEEVGRSDGVGKGNVCALVEVGLVGTVWGSVWVGGSGSAGVWGMWVESVDGKWADGWGMCVEWWKWVGGVGNVGGVVERLSEGCGECVGVGRLGGGCGDVCVEWW